MYSAKYPKFFPVLQKLQESVHAMKTGKDDPLLANRSSIFAALGMTPDPWQMEVMKCEAQRILVLASRQSGKSLTIGLYALTEALLNPPNSLGVPATILIFSPTLKQSAETLRKIQRAYHALREGRMYRRVHPFAPKSVKGDMDAVGQIYSRGILPEEKAISDCKLSLELASGARIICLPAKSENVVSYTATLIIIDEAAKMPNDELFLSVSPMLGASQGRMILLSTPFGKRGFFWEQYKLCEEAKANSSPEIWQRFESTVDDCPRISQEFLDREKLVLGTVWYDQEYRCRFLDSMNAVFHYDDIQAALNCTSLPEYEIPASTESKIWFT